MSLIWCETDVAALRRNMEAFRALVGSDVLLAPTVKGEAYGHGLEWAARAFLDGGADWLCVATVEEVERLRRAGITVPIHVVGYVERAALGRAVAADARLVVYDVQTIRALAALGHGAGPEGDRPIRLHLKLETGNHRQGVQGAEAVSIARAIADAPHLQLEGVSSHFANIEDTTDHRYARQQLARFEAEIAALHADGHATPIRHLSNTAAALLWPDQAFEMVRIGIGGYGLWPSKETRIAALMSGRGATRLQPALTWKTRVAQVKSVPAGAAIGYGCTYITTHPTRLAILPVGYYDGYDRGLGNLAHVLVRQHRAPVRGRVCMNVVMVDVTDVPGVSVEDEVVLLGRQGELEITAEQLADWADTINYEVVTRIGGHLERRPVSSSAPEDASEASAYRPPR
jgi:alanine racemase